MDNKKEMVNHPDHYNQGDIECIDAMIAAKGIVKVMNFCECSAFKYDWRLGHKDDEDQEIGKMEWYLNKYKELRKSVKEKSEPKIKLLRKEGDACVGIEYASEFDLGKKYRCCCTTPKSSMPFKVDKIYMCNQIKDHLCGENGMHYPIYQLVQNGLFFEKVE